jgi:hypothetical protein
MNERSIVFVINVDQKEKVIDSIALQCNNIVLFTHSLVGGETNTTPSPRTNNISTFRLVV